MYKILKAFKGSPDGFTVIDYAEGEQVDLVPDLATVAIDNGWAEAIDGVSPAPTQASAIAPVASKPLRTNKAKAKK